MAKKQKVFKMFKSQKDTVHRQPLAARRPEKIYCTYVNVQLSLFVACEVLIHI